MGFGIYSVRTGLGRLGIAPMPGRLSPLAEDIRVIAEWRPAIVVTLTSKAELDRAGVTDLPEKLKAHGIAWAHLAITDFGIPDGGAEKAWKALSPRLHNALEEGHGVLLHCAGGQGRSGMMALRLLVERGEEPQAALARLRAVRPAAVETAAQYEWAAGSR